MILKNLARYFFRRKLHLNENKSEITNFHFESVRKVGIVFNADSADQIEAVKNYMIILINHGKDVEAIGITKVKDKESLSNFNLNIHYLTTKDINLFGFPNPEFVDAFIEQKLDLLIDLTTNQELVTEYISTLSNAVLKAGSYSKRNEAIYDMMITIDQSTTLHYFIEQVDFYLKMINKKAA